MKKDIITTALLTFCLTATLFMIATTRSQEYDPWSDLNGDGIIDILDVVRTTNAYSTTGDPTKNVNVMNWPVATSVTVAYGITNDLLSMPYNASGFGHMHIAWHVSGLTDPESVTIYLESWIWNQARTSGYSLVVSSLPVTSGNQEGSMSFPVPSEEFMFYINFASGTTASLGLTFYLTYA